MRWTYCCPKCGARLNPDRSIILTASRAEQRILIGFHPEPGNYEIYVPPDVQIEEGAAWDFFCPVCRESLVTEENENLCSLDLIEAEGRRRVLFSRIAGEKATFVVSGGAVEEKHGEHADSYDRKLARIRF